MYFALQERRPCYTRCRSQYATENSHQNIIFLQGRLGWLVGYLMTLYQIQMLYCRMEWEDNYVQWRWKYCGGNCLGSMRACCLLINLNGIRNITKPQTNLTVLSQGLELGSLRNFTASQLRQSEFSSNTQWQTKTLITGTVCVSTYIVFFHLVQNVPFVFSKTS